MTNAEFEAAIADFPDWMQVSAGEIRRLVHQVADAVEETVKWSQPVFALEEPVCYLQAHSQHLNLGFFNGAELEDPAGLLAGTGKRMRHLKLLPNEPVPAEIVTPLLQQAFARAKGETDG